jgi:hypothetical protein
MIYGVYGNHFEEAPQPYTNELGCFTVRLLFLGDLIVVATEENKVIQ